jgi:hypothetical protein
VDGRVHMNTVENSWSLVKRGLNGTYANVEPFYLFRYLAERVLRSTCVKGPTSGALRQSLEPLVVVG